MSATGAMWNPLLAQIKKLGIMLWMKSLQYLQKVGAIISNSHFVGTSGLHFDTYVNKDFLYPHTEDVQGSGELFAEKFKDAGIEVVVGPAMGEIILSQWTAYALSRITGRED